MESSLGLMSPRLRGSGSGAAVVEEDLGLAPRHDYQHHHEQHNQHHQASEHD